MKKSAITIAIIAAAICIALLLSDQFQRKPTHQVRSRIYLDDKESTGVYDPFLWPNQLQIISNFLCQSEIHRHLAEQSGVRDEDFRLVRVESVKNTRLVYAQFTGVQSNQLICVASNAAVMLGDYYSTNQPAWDVRYVEPDYFVPTPYWQGKMIELKTKFDSLFHR